MNGERRVSGCGPDPGKRMLAALCLALSACTPTVQASVEVSDPDRRPLPGAALSVVDAQGFKRHRPADVDGCIHAAAVPGRMGGRDGMLTLAAPGYPPAHVRIHVRGRLAYAAVLQPDAATAASRLRPLPSPSRCGRR